MSYKVTISGGTVLENCIEHVSFSVDTPNDYNSNIRNSMIITGQIDTEESTVSLYEWALIPATNSGCYKEITVEQYQKNLLVRKVTFSKAFVIDYSENYSKKLNVLDKQSNNQVIRKLSSMKKRQLIQNKCQNNQ
jgi:predicted proteasome-type protease